MTYSRSSGTSSVYIIIGVGVVLILLISGLYFFNSNKTGQYDQFAQCIKDSGTIFYGAFWCPHCQNQKKMFGSSQKYLPYVECSTPDGRDQTSYCDQKGIDGYPTWTFPDGSKLSGEIPLTTLAEKTDCPMYHSATSTATSTF